MNDGAPLNTQAALADRYWIGYADYLVRVEEPCQRWQWSYEPWDAKLAHHAKPEHVMQIALYGDLLEKVQGRAAEFGALMLGSRDPAAPYVIERFRLAEVRHYVRRAAARLKRFSEDLPTGLMPEPCGKCDWAPNCETAWDAADHLSRVADITRKQRQHLLTAGISTAALLSTCAESRIAGIGSEKLGRLIQQARLQKQSKVMERGIYELLPLLAGLGLARLAPS